MPSFSYEAKKGPQQVIKAKIEAESLERAVEKITQMGYVPIRVIPDQGTSRSSGATSVAARRPGSGWAIFKKVRPADLTLFTEQLTSLIKAKVPLLEALKVIHEQTENQRFKEILAEVLSEVRDGQALSQAIAKFPGVFPQLYINMISTGEAGGVLEKTLRRLVQFRNKEEELKSKISTALAYPVFIIFVGIITVFILLGFVIPKMSSLFNEIGQDLPVSTQILLASAQALKRYWYWLLAAIALLLLFISRQKPTERQELLVDQLKIRLPLIGDFTRKSILARFARTLAILLANGIPLFQAIKITVPTVESGIFRSELEGVHKDIAEGSSLEQGLKKTSWFPSFVTSMLAVGEKGGNLEEALLEIADFYDREVDKATKVFTSLIEPVIILVMAILVGFIVFALLLPIFQINLGIR
ncbi:type II secretion system F family protein [Candidatus Omnitrophota bacterium]